MLSQQHSLSVRLIQIMSFFPDKQCYYLYCWLLMCSGGTVAKLVHSNDILCYFGMLRQTWAADTKHQKLVHPSINFGSFLRFIITTIKDAASKNESLWSLKCHGSASYPTNAKLWLWAAVFWSECVEENLFSGNFQWYIIAPGVIWYCYMYV